MNRGMDLLLAAWFVLVGVAFWGPYYGFGLPSNLLTALYALFLLISIAALALRLLGRTSSGDTKGSNRGK